MGKSGGKSGGGGGGGGDGGAAALASQMAQANAMLAQGKKEGYGFLDAAKQQGLDPLLKALQPNATNIASSQLGYLNNFGENVQADVNRASQAYLKPSQDLMKEQFGNLVGSLGAGGANNSRSQLLLGRLGEGIASKEAQRQLELEQSVRANKLGEAQSLYNTGFGTANDLSGQLSSLAGQKANIGIGVAKEQAGNLASLGTQLAGIQQQQQQRKDAQAGAKGQAFGAGLGTIGNIAGSIFSDIRLKENLKQVGKLDNGLNIYLFNYIGEEIPQLGVIAQEVQLVNPSAVVEDELGFLKVDYKKVVE